jgi:isopenicillin-N epimerase
MCFVVMQSSVVWPSTQPLPALEKPRQLELSAEISGAKAWGFSSLLVHRMCGSFLIQIKLPLGKGFPMKTLKDLRTEVLLPSGCAYLNSGSCSPILKGVAETADLWRQQSYRDPIRFFWTTAQEKIKESRSVLAQFLACDSQDLLLFPNVSFAMNLVLGSLSCQTGAMRPLGDLKQAGIITTNQEYPHLLKHLKALEKRGLTLHIVDIDSCDTDEDLLAAFQNALDLADSRQPIKAIFFSHVTTGTGMTLPARELCHFARENDLLSIVDGAHAPGICSINLSEMEPTFYGGNIHKWLMGPMSAAFLYVEPTWRNTLIPMQINEFSDCRIAEDSLTDFAATKWQAKMEFLGTRDLVPLIVIHETLERFQEVANAGSEAAWRRLRQYTVDTLGKIGFRPFPEFAADSARDKRLTPLVTFLIEGGDPIELWQKFRKVYDIELAFPRVGDKGLGLRVSATWFNEESDIDRLCAALLAEGTRPVMPNH